MRKVIFIVGPTAVGKTDLSLELAKRLNGEIVSADSVQVFQGLDIGSAKPSMVERQGISHHVLDCVTPESPYSVGSYVNDAKTAIFDILSRGKQPIVTGGTGLYVNALLYDMDFGSSPSDLQYRAALEALAEKDGNEAVHALLAAVDPESADKIHFNNLKRVIRALEVNEVTGKPMKDFTQHPVRTQDFDTLLIGLTRDRLNLYTRINKRVDLMLEAGLLEEVKKLKNLGLDDSLQSMQGIGYKEVLFYLNGHCDYDTMVHILKQNSRHYAKRQMTWFKRYEDMHWIDLDQQENTDTVVGSILLML